jgi:hypothetical protein
MALATEELVLTPNSLKVLDKRYLKKDETGKVIEYPMPYADNGMRDFFLDQDGHMWYGSPPNNRVGYFYVSTRRRDAAN